MIFRIINPAGVGVMKTEYQSCIPKKDVLESMNAAGFRFELNGKRIKLRELIEFRQTGVSL